MAYAKLGWQVHINYMITRGLFQNKEQRTRVSLYFIYCKHHGLCSSEAKMLLLSLTPECSILGIWNATFCASVLALSLK